MEDEQNDDPASEHDEDDEENDDEDDGEAGASKPVKRRDEDFESRIVRRDSLCNLYCSCMISLFCIFSWYSTVCACHVRTAKI